MRFFSMAWVVRTSCTAPPTGQTPPRPIVQPDALRAHTCNFGADPLLPLCEQNGLKKESLSSLSGCKERRQRLPCPPRLWLCSGSWEGWGDGFESVPGHSQECHPTSTLLELLGLPPASPNSSLSILEKICFFFFFLI